jgi:hypothetical protein
MQLDTPIMRGRRVRLRRDFVGRQCRVRAGHTGVVAFSDGDCVGVRLDQPVPDLEDWGNVLHFYGDNDPGCDPDSEVAAYCEGVA